MFLLIFTYKSSWAVVVQQYHHNQTHQEQYGHIEPEGLDVPFANNLLTTIERSPSDMAAGGEEHGYCTGYDITVDDVQ